jgi:phospholipid N-methyltransferase
MCYTVIPGHPFINLHLSPLDDVFLGIEFCFELEFEFVVNAVPAFIVI